MHNDFMNKHEMVENILKLLDGIAVKGSENVVLLSEAFQMLFALKKGLKDEDNAKNKIIESLKEQLKRANEIKTEQGGTVIGGEHFDFNFSEKDGVDNGNN